MNRPAENINSLVSHKIFISFKKTTFKLETTV